MKLFIVLFIAVATISTLTFQSQADAKKGKNNRKISSAESEVFNATLTALNRSTLLKNSNAMVNNHMNSSTFECSDFVENTELKGIEPAGNKSYRFTGVRMCFDQAGPGVVEIQYDGLLKNSQIQEIKIKLNPETAAH